MNEQKPGYFKNGEPYFEPAAEKRERASGVFKPRVRCQVKVADLANAAADESRSDIDYLTITRSIIMNALDKSAQAGKPYEIDRLSGRMIEVMREIGRITGEVRDFASTTINIQNNTQILNSQPFMLCTDKTGTLTEATIKLVRAIDGRGAESQSAFAYAFINSRFETGMKSPLDEAILAVVHGAEIVDGGEAL